MVRFLANTKLSQEDYIKLLEDTVTRADAALRAIQVGGLTVSFQNVNVRLYERDPALAELSAFWTSIEAIERKGDHAAQLKEFPRLLAYFQNDLKDSEGGTDHPEITGEEQLPHWLDYELASKLEAYLNRLHDPNDAEDRMPGGRLLNSTMDIFHEVGLTNGEC